MIQISQAGMLFSYTILLFSYFFSIIFLVCLFHTHKKSYHGFYNIMYIYFCFVFQFLHRIGEQLPITVFVKLKKIEFLRNALDGYHSIFLKRSQQFQLKFQLKTILIFFFSFFFSFFLYFVRAEKAIFQSDVNICKKKCFP